MKQSVKKCTLALVTLYLSGLIIILFAYKKGSVESELMQYYVLAGGLLAVLGYRFSKLYNDKFDLGQLITRDQFTLTAQSASGFINYSKTAIPISQISNITIAQGYLLIELKNAKPEDKTLEFFFPASKVQIQTHLFRLLDSTELNKIQLNLLAE
ncbi:hypothetical protein N7931_16500 [Catenovulum sp. 2E275]|uniref:hypothetical protein n=1 Tax=Catenovulum sp. 2E275 TaxID=2980497 RepID=UPI0021D114FC|nr:hypothetical protein [Catenovulum sp. 2E275]MCU4677231.1 hypothetical protein [Catenovulum sp. 2E275]